MALPEITPLDGIDSKLEKAAEYQGVRDQGVREAPTIHTIRTSFPWYLAILDRKVLEAVVFNTFLDDLVRILRTITACEQALDAANAPGPSKKAKDQNSDVSESDRAANLPKPSKKSKSASSNLFECDDTANTSKPRKKPKSESTDLSECYRELKCQMDPGTRKRITKKYADECLASFVKFCKTIYESTVSSGSSKYKFEALNTLLDGAIIIVNLKGSLRENMHIRVQRVLCLEYAFLDIMVKMGKKPRDMMRDISDPKGLQSKLRYIEEKKIFSELGAVTAEVFNRSR